MRSARLILVLSSFAMVTGSAVSQTTRTVGQGGGFDFATIQEAIDAATTGDTIIVHPGTYFENIQFEGKNIVLRSTDPLDPATVAATIIDGRSTGSVVTFSGTETELCLLQGFTIQNGSSGFGAGVQGGGTHARIWDNLIRHNTAGRRGGGLDDCDGSIWRNQITDNWAGVILAEGGGLAGCDGHIFDNEISDNSAYAELGGAGGGLYDCNGIIEGNRILGNGVGAASPFLISGGSGGGVHGGSGILRNNLIAGNAAGGDGAGVSWFVGTIESNTIVLNRSAGNPINTFRGGGIANCTGPILNCIVWENEATTDNQISSSTVPSYSCIQDWTGGGGGNIRDDPLFVDGPLGPYYLSQIAAGQLFQSPCVDAGSSLSAVVGLADRTTRIDSVLDAGSVDMGYHYPPAGELPNLSVSATNFTPQLVDSFTPTVIQFTGSVRNLSSRTVTEPFWIEFFLHLVDQAPQPQVYLCDSILVNEPLEGGGAIDLADHPRTTYGLLPGVYTLGIRVDPLGQVFEQDESDNLIWLPQQPLYVGAPLTRTRNWTGYR